MKTKNKMSNSGFSVVEVLAAIYLLSFAVLSVFALSSRSISLSAQSTVLQNSTFYAEDAFSMTSQLVNNNRLASRSFDYGFFDLCSGQYGCNMTLQSSGEVLVTTCSSSGCLPLYINNSGFLFQGNNPQNGLLDLKTIRSIKMSRITADEIKVDVIIDSSFKNKKINRTFTQTFNNWYEPEDLGDNVKIYVTSIVCPNESDLPNWGEGSNGAPSVITSTTASSWLASNQNCDLASGWSYQWGHDPDFLCYEGVSEPYPDHIGEANGTGPYTLGTTTGPGFNEWKTFGPSGANGIASVLVKDLKDAYSIAIRTVLKQNYLPFSYIAERDLSGPSSCNLQSGTGNALPGYDNSNFSSEFYCHTDVLNYDNYDFIGTDTQALPDNNYYCVLFTTLN